MCLPFCIHLSLAPPTYNQALYFGHVFERRPGMNRGTHYPGPVLGARFAIAMISANIQLRFADRKRCNVKTIIGQCEMDVS